MFELGPISDEFPIKKSTKAFTLTTNLDNLSDRIAIEFDGNPLLSPHVTNQLFNKTQPVITVDKIMNMTAEIFNALAQNYCEFSRLNNDELLIEVISSLKLF